MYDPLYRSIPGWIIDSGISGMFGTGKLNDFVNSLYKIALTSPKKSQPITLEYLGEHNDLTRERMRQRLMQLADRGYHLGTKVICPYDRKIEIDNRYKLFFRCFISYLNKIYDYDNPIWDHGYKRKVEYLYHEDQEMLRHYYIVMSKIYKLGFDNIINHLHEDIFNKVKGREYYTGKHVKYIGKTMKYYGTRPKWTEDDIGKIIYNYLFTLIPITPGAKQPLEQS